MSSYRLSLNQEFKYIKGRKDFVSGLFSFSENIDVNKLKFSCELVVELTESFHYIQEDVSAFFPILTFYQCTPEITVLNEPNYSTEKFYELITDCIKEENLFNNSPVKFFIVNSDKTYLGVFISSLYADNKSLGLIVDRILAIYLSDKNDFNEEINFLNFSQWQKEILDEEVKDENYYLIEEIDIKDFSNPRIFKADENNDIVNPTPIVRDVFSINKLSFDIHDIIAVIYNSIAQYSDSDNFSLGYIPFERNHDILNKTVGLLNVPLPIRTNYKISSIEKIKRLSHQIQDLESNRDNFNYSILNQEYLKISVERYVDTAIKDNPLGVKQEVYFPYEFNSQLKIILFESDDIVKVKILCNINAPYLQFIENQIKQNLENFIQYNDVAQSASSQEINFYLGNNWITKEVRNEFLGINKLLADIFKRYPAYPCLTFLEDTLTFQQVNSLSNTFANYLSEKFGIKQSDNVGLLLPRGLDQILTLLSIIKTGACFVPLEKDWPEFRIGLLKKEAKLTLIVNEQIIEEFHKTKHLYSDDYDLAPVSDESPLYCIFTSGTTGNPKGCQINNKNFYNYLNWTYEYFKDFPQKKVGYFSPISFDFTLTSIFGSFISGSNLLISEPDSNLLSELNQLILHDEVCVLKITPAHVFLLDENLLKDASPKTFILGGEALTEKQITHLRNNQGCKIYNEYGPTEATVGCIVHLIKEDNLPLIGRPIPGMSALIVNQDNNILPVGCKGELVLSGEGVINRYLNSDNSKLDTKFTKISVLDDNRVYYKTGDYGVLRCDGAYEYFGRFDDQIKLNGYRIELSEVEILIRKIDGVKEAVVILETVISTKQLLAFYVGSLSYLDVQNEISKILPAYSVPAQIIQVDTLPINNNGKIDRNRLVEIALSNNNNNNSISSLSSQNEFIVAYEFAKSLGLNLNRLGKESNFIALGGDSIKAIQIVARLRNTGYELKISDVMGSSRLQDMAAKLKPLTRKIDQGAVEGEVLLSPIQRAFLTNAFAKGTVAEKQLFHQGFMLCFSGGLSIEETRAIIEKLIAHHDVLRIRYEATEEGEWRQYNGGLQGDYYILEEVSLPSSIKDKQKKEAFFEEQGNSLKQRIGFKEGPLLGVGLYHDTEVNESHLLLSIHHMVIDLVSWRILFEDIDTLLNQYRKGKKLTLPDKTDSYHYWMEQSKEYAQGHLLERQRTYWEHQQTAKTDTIPIKYPKGNNTFEVSKRVGFVLSKEETALVQQGMNAKNKVETNAILLAALSRALKNTFGAEQVRILLEGHGREDYLEKTDISRTVGWFTSMYPFVLDGKKEDVESVLLLQDSLTQVPDKGVGYGLLRYLSNEPLSAMEDAQVTFNYLGDFTREEKEHTAPTSKPATTNNNTNNTTTNNTFSYSQYGHGLDVHLNLTRESELDVSGRSEDGYLQMSIQYSAVRMDVDQMQELAKHYKAQLLKLSEELIQYDKTLQLPGSFTYKGLSLEQIAALSKEYGEIEDVYRLSPMQQGLYYHALSEPDSHAYFEQFGYGLKGELDIAKLEQAYRTLIARHGVLRTVFRNNLGEEPLQVVLKEGIIDFRVEDIRDKDPDEQQAYIKALREDDKDEGFDLSAGPLVRLIIVQQSENRFYQIWSNHHLNLDGWSTNAVLYEFDRSYKSLIGNQPITLSNLEPYSRYIAWLDDIDQQKSKSYWRDYLTDYDSKAILPYDKEELTQHTGYIAKDYDFWLSEELSNNLNAIAQKEKTTLNTIVQSAWGILLSRYNNTQDVVFGSVVSGRPSELKGIQEMIGIFINTVPQRISYTDQTTFSELLQSTQQSFIAGEPHHHLNLAEIQHESELGTNLIDHLVVFENYPISGQSDATTKEDLNTAKGDVSIEGDTVEWFEQMNYDFSLMVAPEDRLFFRMSYNGEKYSEGFIKRLEGQWKQLLGEIAKSTQTSITAYDILTQEEKTYLLETLNDTKADYPKDKTIVDLFEEQVKHNPENIAVKFKNTELTYKELNEKSNQLAHYLIQNYNIQPDELVGIELERSEWMVIGILAIIKSGGAYVPIDPEYPKQRKAFIKRDANLKLILNELELDKFKEANQNKEYPSINPNIKLSSNNLMYVIYTSGSTGNPKGVLVEHVSCVNIINTYFRTKVKCALTCNYNFDVSVLEIFSSLTSGAELYIPEFNVVADIAQYLLFLEINNIDTVYLHPFWIEDFRLYPDSLKNVLTGVEPVYYRALSTLFTDGRTVINGYGPTETTICSSFFELHKLENNVGKLPIGKPLPNTQTYLLDSNHSLAPFGSIGEICIGGVGLARGYLNREELTKEKFIPNPYNPSKRLYKTGDLGRWREDGNLEYLGRMDDQVKIRGYRIELGEIEQAISSHKASGQAVVIARAINNATDKELIAYTTGEATAKELKTYLKERLPSYMVPNYYVKLESIPLTSNGKVDRKALPDPEGTGLKQGEYVAPSTETEKKLVKIWSEVLGVEESTLSIKADFFDLGGHSLRAIKLMSILNREFSLKNDLGFLFENSSIEEIADLITSLALQSKSFEHTIRL